MQPISKSVSVNKKVCIFCYKSTAADFNIEAKDISIKNFIEFLERFMDEEAISKKSGKLYAPFKLETYHNLLTCCKDCLVVTNSFCKAYQNYKSLELWLFWKIERLLTVMKLAGRVPSRMVLLKSIFQTDNLSEHSEAILAGFKSFRRNLMRKCTLKLSKSFPRVSLKRLDDPSQFDELRPQTHPKLNFKYPNSFALDNFLGWMMSLAAVALLATSSTGNSLQSNDDASLVELPLSSDEDSILDENEDAKGNDQITHEKAPITSPIRCNQDPVVEHDIEFHEDDSKILNQLSPTFHPLATKEELWENDNDSLLSSSSSEGETLESDPVSKQEQSQNEYSDNDLQSESTSGSPNSHNNFLESMTNSAQPGPVPTSCPVDNVDETLCRSTSVKNHSSVSIRSLEKPEQAGAEMNEESGEITTVTSQEDLMIQAGSDTIKPFDTVNCQVKEESIVNVTSHYNFRQRRKRSYQTIENEDNNAEGDNDSNASENLFFEESSNSSIEMNLEAAKESPKKVKTEKDALRLDDTSTKEKTNIRDNTENKNEDIILEQDAKERKVKTSSSLLGFKKRKIKCNKKWYICSAVHCKEKFRTAKKLNDHKKLHGYFKCDFCQVEKEYAPDLALHETEHSFRTEDLKKEYNCPKCKFGCYFKSFYIRHYLETHLNINCARVACAICGIESVKKKVSDFMRDHMKAYHKIDDLKPEDIQRCNQCSAYFRENRQLCIHKYKIHFTGKCPDCGKIFSKYRLLIEHLDHKHPNHNHFPNLKLCCSRKRCLKKFATQAELEEHKRQTSHQEDDKQNIICSKCGKELKNRQHLSMHMHNVHSKTTNICPQCGKTFKTRVNLNIHLEYHKSPEEWKFQCSTCQKRFPTKQKSDEHTRTHTKEKPFICQFCGEKYAHRHNWKNHVKTKHPNEYDEKEFVVRAKGNFLSRKGSKKGDFITTGTKRD